MFDLTFTTPISFLVSIAALAGVTLHDTKIDKLATSMANVHSSSVSSSTDAPLKIDTGNAHTHVERVHLTDGMQPRIVPRNDHKKHMMQKHEPRGKHRFDGYNLPI